MLVHLTYYPQRQPFAPSSHCKNNTMARLTDLPHELVRKVYEFLTYRSYRARFKRTCKFISASFVRHAFSAKMLAPLESALRLRRVEMDRTVVPMSSKVVLIRGHVHPVTTWWFSADAGLWRYNRTRLSDYWGYEDSKGLSMRGPRGF